MANYLFTKNTTKLNATEIWAIINQSLKKGSVIKSIIGIPYTISGISINVISYIGEDRSNGESESISKESFINVIKGLKKLGTFNSNLSKEVFQKAKVYRQRSPMFAILLTTGLIEKK